MKRLLELYARTLRDCWSPVNIYALNDDGDSSHRRAALNHVAWMLDNMPDTHVDQGKFNRWVGFVQGVFWAHRIFTLNQLREQTREAGTQKPGERMLD